MSEEMWLDGIRCPRCGETEYFQVTSTVVYDVFAGTAVPLDDGIDDDSAVRCGGCPHTAPLKEFRTP